MQLQWQGLIGQACGTLGPALHGHRHMATDRLLCFAFSYFCPPVKWGVRLRACPESVGTAPHSAGSSSFTPA